MTKLGYFHATRNKPRSPNYKIREVQYLQKNTGFLLY